MTTVEIRGLYVTADGQPATGRVVITPRVAVVGGAGAGALMVAERVVADLDVTGAFAVDVYASDDPALTPSGWTYRIVEQVRGAGERAYDIDVPAAAAVAGIDLVDVAPAAASVGAASAFVTLTAHSAEVAARIAADALLQPLATAVTAVAGRTGVVTLAEADVTGLVADLAAKLATSTAEASYRRNISPLAFGASLDNRTGNYTAAIQAALDAAFDIGGGQVVIPYGTAWRADQLHIPLYVHLRGEVPPHDYGHIAVPTCSGLWQASGINDDFICIDPALDDPTFAGPFGISDLILMGDFGSTAGNGIAVRSLANVDLKTQDLTTIARVLVRRFAESGIYMPGGGPAYVEDIVCLFNGGYGIRVVDSGASGATGRVQHMSFKNISGDGNSGGAVMRFEGVQASFGHSLVGIKAERRPNIDRGGADAQTNVLQFDSCAHAVTIQGLSSISKGDTTQRPGDIITITGTARPTITWAGAGIRELAAQTVGTAPVMIKDSVTPADVPLVPAGHYGTSKLYGAPLQTLYLPGATANLLSCPDAAGLRVVNDIDLIAKVALDDWTPASAQYLIARDNFASNRSFYFRVNTTGTLALNTSSTGDNTALGTGFSSVATGVADGATKWVRATRVKATGVIQFFLSDDGVTWTQLGGNVSGGNVGGGIFAGTRILEVGSAGGAGLNQLAGKVFRAIVKDGVGGTVVADYRAEKALRPAYTDSAGNPWTITGTTWSWRRSIEES